MKNCPFCGKELPEEMTFCLYCMNKLAPEEQIKNNSVAKKKTTFVVILIIVAFVLAVAVICGVFVLPKLIGKGKESVVNSITENEEQTETVVRLEKYLGKDYGEIISVLGEYEYCEYGEMGDTLICTHGYIDVHVGLEYNDIQRIVVHYNKTDDKTKYSIADVDGTFTFGQVMDKMGEPIAASVAALGYYYGQGRIDFNFDNELFDEDFENGEIKSIDYYMTN